MLEFWLALGIFLASHSVIANRKLRPRLIRLCGEKLYLILYSLLSFVLLGWVIIAAQAAPRTDLWPWHHALYWVPNILMPFAFALIAAGLFVPNPLSVTPRQHSFDPSRLPLTVALTRHPVMWGGFLWAASHMVPNGEYPLVLMFGIFAGFFLLGIVIMDRKARRNLGAEAWQSLSRNTSACLFTSKALWQGNFTITRRDGVGIAIGLLTYIAFYHAHGYLFGISPNPPL